MFPKLFSSLFKNQQSKNSLKKDIFHKLELLKLEQRITPAVNLSPVIQLPENNLVIITQDLLSKVPQQELVNATVVTLDPAQDVISQISNQLANRNGLDTVRIISHGEDGELVFGNQVMDQKVLLSRGGEIASWGKALALDADILLYGCSVAGSESGKNFVATLGRLTGADVAASTNPTGAGADTTLEYNAGLVTASLQASSQAWNESSLQLPQSGDFTYISSGSDITITGYTGAGGPVVIPSTIASLPVTSIGNYAFQNNINFTSNTNLTSINIPATVTSISNYAFSGCSGLTAINVDSSNPNYSSLNGILYNKTQTILIQCPAGITGSITIPTSVTGIGDNAFQGCSSLTSISIPSGVISIGDSAFSGCSGLTSITIPSGVNIIRQNTFSWCMGLTSITIPNLVTSIGDNAFQYCQGLASITLGNGVTTIGQDAFSGCRGLTSITIPSSVTTIGQDAFSDCIGLTAITVDLSNASYSS